MRWVRCGASIALVAALVSIALAAGGRPAARLVRARTQSHGPHVRVKRRPRPPQAKRAPTVRAAAPVIVAVVDGGVDVTHPALAAHLWTNPREIPGNGKDDDGDGIVDDVHGASFVDHSGNVTDQSGHGTHVAGIVASIDPNAKIMALKAGTGEWIDLDEAADAIEYAIAHGARIVNLSWAALDGDGALARALQDAAAHDVLVVAAAGNFGTSNDLRPVYPASYEDSTLLSVAATCDNQTLAGFSDYGKASVSLAAPGCSITSTLPGGAYGTLSGTSMAAPAVAGTAALLLESHPSATAHDLERAILGGSQPSGAFAPTLISGGALSVKGAEAAIASPDTATPAQFAELAPSSSFSAARDPSYYYADVAFSWTPSRDADLAGYRVLVDGNVVAATAPDQTSVAAKVPPGTHTWTVVAYDRSGNSTAAAGH